VTKPRGRTGKASTLPGGTVTFLLTDVESSTRLWEAHPQAMRKAMARHDEIVAERVGAHGGSVVRSRGEGDSSFAVFPVAGGAVAAALDLQRSLLEESWPRGVSIRVRVALHTGEAQLREGDYYGTVVNRCARIRAIAHGGQTLVSRTTRDVVVDQLPPDARLHDLGPHRLKDLAEPEQVFQLDHPDLPADFPPLRGLEALAHNLPIQLTSFIDREKEMADVKELLARSRLVTLAGAAGCGKTRLALQVAADLVDQYAGGVWLVELSSTMDPELLPLAIAQSLGLREQTLAPSRRSARGGSAGREFLDMLVERLAGPTVLLVIDNSEHLVSAVAEAAEQLLRSCPRLTIVATSREVLGAPGEVVWRVPSLASPDPSQLPNVDALFGFPAVALFIDRARLHQPDFTMSEADARCVARICRRVDGIPLAIELAAARVKALTVEQIAARLADQFALLTGGARTALPRQRTMRAAVDWSYELLDEVEQTLLQRLSVFVGGFTLEAIEDVCVDGPVKDAEVLDTLSRLVDKSLVIHETSEIGARYRLMDSIRQYADEKLAQSGQTARIRTRHRDWYRMLAEQGGVELTGAEQTAWLSTLEQEHDNLRAALDWSIATRDGDAALRLAVGLRRFWLERGHLTEGRRRLQDALSVAAPVPSLLRSRGLRGAGRMALDQGDYGAARTLHEEAFAVARQLDSKEDVAESLRYLGQVAYKQGDYVHALTLYEEALRCSRELGNSWFIGVSLIDLGELSRTLGDVASAQHYLEEGLALARDSGDKRNIAESLISLGELADGRGKLDAAERLLEEALAIARELGEKTQVARSLLRLGKLAAEQGRQDAATALEVEALKLNLQLYNREAMAECLEALANLASAAKDAARVARLLGAAHALRDTIRSPVDPSEERQLAEAEDAARAELGSAPYLAAWTEGTCMVLEEAVKYAVEMRVVPVSGHSPRSSPRST